MAFGFGLAAVFAGAVGSAVGGSSLAAAGAGPEGPTEEVLSGLDGAGGGGAAAGPGIAAIAAAGGAGGSVLAGDGDDGLGRAAVAVALPGVSNWSPLMKSVAMPVVFRSSARSQRIEVCGAERSSVLMLSCIPISLKKVTIFS